MCNSRATTFVTESAAVSRTGVRAVLNSLTSSGMVAASLAALGEGGQMVEIGKRDIWGAPAVKCERRDVAYSIVALDMLPALSNSLLLQRLAQAWLWACWARVWASCTALRRLLLP